MEIIKLNLIPSGVNPTCHCSQYDEGRVIRIELFDGLTPYVLQSGDTVTLNVRKPDNTIVTGTVSTTQDNNYVDIVTTEQICACVGYNLCDLTLTNGSKVIGTLNFIMAIERDVLADGIPSQSVIEDLDALVQEAVGDNYYTKEETDEHIDDALKDVYPLAEASGEIASFNTGVILPLKSCEVDINPIQDLHGYSNPWIAGAGKNKFGFEEWLKSFSIQYTKNGNAYTFTTEGNSVLFSSPYVFSNTDIAIALSSTITIPSGSTAASVGFELLDANNNPVTNRVMQATATACKIRLNWSRQGVVTVTEPQIELGSQPTAFAPYENICNISGTSNAIIRQNNGNFFNLEGWLKSNNIPYTKNGNEFTFEPVQALYANPFVFADDNINISASVSSFTYNGTNLRLVFLDKNNVTQTTLATGNFIRENFNACKVRLDWSVKGTSITIGSPMINVGQTTKPYIAYKGKNTTIGLGQTVYGGKLNVTTGALTINKIYIKPLTLTKNSWAVGTKSCCYRVNLTNVSTSVSGSEVHGAISNMNIEYPSYYGAARPNELDQNGFAINQDGSILAIYDTDLTLSEAQFTTKYADFEVVYPLATPIEVQLTPTELRTLLGQNIIYANTDGDIDVIYHQALTAKYIFFDNTGTELQADNVEDAIKEILTLIQGGNNSRALNLSKGSLKVEAPVSNEETATEEPVKAEELTTEEEPEAISDSENESTSDEER